MADAGKVTAQYGRTRKSKSLRSTPKAVKLVELERKALELRKAGLTYEHIAKELEMSKTGVWKAVQRGLAKYTIEPAQDLIKLETSRLDAMQAAMWRHARRGNLKAVDRTLRVMERRSRLLGLDAAVEVKHTVDLMRDELFEAMRNVCSNPEVYASVAEAKDCRPVLVAWLEEITRLEGEIVASGVPSGEPAPAVH